MSLAQGTSINADLILRNWGLMQTSGLLPSVNIKPQFLRISVCIYECALARLMALPHFSEFGWHLPVRPRYTHGIPPLLGFS